jgi:uncharacterized protein (TIGR04551 family)
VSIPKPTKDRVRTLARLGILGLVLALPASALGQMGPGMGQPGGQVGGEDEEQTGTAEKAPEDNALTLPTVPTLPPYPGEQEKAFQLITFDGYLRLRTSWMRNFHLGFRDLGNGTPFPRALSCAEGTSANPSTCGTTIGTANMRFRFEPTIHLSEKVAIHTQIDFLDNVVLGSTTEGVFLDGASPGHLQVDAFNDSQAPPEAGRNSLQDSVRVKRVWADVQTPLGLLKFGRMPKQFGLGLRDNAGADLDDDYGDTVDRVMFSRGIPGTSFTAGLAMDWGGNGPTSDRLFPERQQGQPWDLDNVDDIVDYVLVISKLDDEDTWRDTLNAGRLGFNWGAMLTYRKQSWELRNPDLTTDPELTAQYQLRDATLYIPDFYLRLGIGKFSFSAEIVAVLGEINHLDDVDGDPDTEGVQGLTDSLGVQQFGWVARMGYELLDGDLELGMEVGFASGDDWEADKQGEVDYRGVPIIPRSDIDGTQSAFLFDPAYQVDFILFRELLGTVRNATYVKPKLSWDITGKVRAEAWAVVSFVNKPVSTPGNGGLWGVEVDADLGYHNDDEGFFAGISYGFLVPLSAMDHPATLFVNEGETGDAGNAHIIKMRLALSF